MQLIVALALLLAAVPAVAQELGAAINVNPNVMLDMRPYAAETVIRATGAREIVRLGVGGCIRGPFTVYGDDGKVLLHLLVGATLPHNCENVR